MTITIQTKLIINKPNSTNDLVALEMTNALLHKMLITIKNEFNHQLTFLDSIPPNIINIVIDNSSGDKMSPVG